jgi:hypothetical protein
VRRLLLLVALVAAAGCKADDTPPPGGGGGGGTGGGGGGGDADAGDGGDGGAGLSGRLCAAVDLRVPLACPAADLGGIAVASGDATATTGAAGTFALDVDSDVLVTMTGGDQPVRDALFATSMWGGDDGLRAPAADLADWNDLVAAIAGFEPDGTASLALYLEDESGPIAGAEILPPDGSQQPYYDSGAPDDWDQGGLTSIYGAALIFAVPSIGGSAELTVALDADTYSVTVPVRDDTLTFARVVLDTAGP